MDPRIWIIPALDKMKMRTALNLVTATGTLVHGYKAHSLIDRYGAPVTVALLREEHSTCWLWGDIKGLDTKDTIRDRAMQMRDNGINAVTVHALGRPEMVAAAVESGLYVIVVTLLSDWSDDYIRQRFKGEPEVIAYELGVAAKDGGAQAIVCSPTQVHNLSSRTELQHLKFIVPGTRSSGVAANDQAQVDTPYNAILNGADYLVAGRQLTQAADSLKALNDLAEEIRPAISIRIEQGSWKDSVIAI